MDVTFLGTGSAYPSPHRGASALVLRTEGECWLFDCGEGTQTQLMRSQLRAGESSYADFRLHPEYEFSSRFPLIIICFLPRSNNQDFHLSLTRRPPIWFAWVTLYRES